ncbi:MAG: AAA family ATPase [Tepidisphaeraceae bacterium]
MIKSMVLKRFRSLPADSVDFDNPTFLVGRNGSGKSNFVDAFAFLAEAMASPLQAVFDRRGGISVVRNRTSGPSYPPNLGLGVVFGPLNGDIKRGRYAFEIRALPNYGFEVVHEQCLVETSKPDRLWFDRSKGNFNSNVSGLGPSLDPALLALPLVGGEARFAPILKTLAALRTYRIEPGKLREMQDPDSGVTLRPDGSNAASVLQEIQRHSGKDLARIGEILATIVPNTKKVQTTKHGNKLSLKFTQKWGVNKRLNFEAFNMSDGTLRALGLLLAVYQRPTPSLMVVEEPEATIHPGALGAILDVLRHASRRMQIVVTTHSPEVLDAEWIEDRHLRVVTWQEGATHVAAISDASRKAIQRHLMGAGELLRSNALDAAPLFFEDVAQAGLFEEVA